MKAKGILVEIPKGLAARFENIKNAHGYMSLSEFVRDAVRDKLDELERVLAKRRLDGNNFIDAEADAEVFEEGRK